MPTFFKKNKNKTQKNPLKAQKAAMQLKVARAVKAKKAKSLDIQSHQANQQTRNLPNVVTYNTNNKVSTTLQIRCVTALNWPTENI